MRRERKLVLSVGSDDVEVDDCSIPEDCSAAALDAHLVLWPDSLVGVCGGGALSIF